MSKEGKTIVFNTGYVPEYSPLNKMLSGTSRVPMKRNAQGNIIIELPYSELHSKNKTSSKP